MNAKFVEEIYVVFEVQNELPSVMGALGLFFVISLPISIYKDNGKCSFNVSV